MKGRKFNNVLMIALTVLLVALAIAALPGSVAALDSNSEPESKVQMVGPGPVSLSADPDEWPSEHMELVMLPVQPGSREDSKILYFGPADDAALKAEYGVDSTYTLWRSYDYTNYGGSTLTGTTTNSDVCDGWVYQWSPMPGGWDNRVESGKNPTICIGSCEQYCHHARYFDQTGYGGTDFTCYDGCVSLGTMNNKASSMRVWR